MPEIIEIQGHLEWFMYREPISKEWIGVCNPIGVTVAGSSRADLMEAIEESLNALMLDLWSHGEFDQFLEKRGWKLLNHLPEKLNKRVEFTVPMNFTEKPAHEFDTFACK